MILLSFKRSLFLGCLIAEQPLGMTFTVHHHSGPPQTHIQKFEILEMLLWSRFHTRSMVL